MTGILLEAGFWPVALTNSFSENLSFASDMTVYVLPALCPCRSCPITGYCELQERVRSELRPQLLYNNTPP